MTRPAPSRSRPVAFLILLTAPLLSGCMWNTSHVRQEKREPTKEEKLDLYTTTATYLYDDGSLVRAQDQAVKALELDPDHRAMRRMIGWIRLRLGRNEDLLVAQDFFRGLRADGDDNTATTLGLATTMERLGLAYMEASRELESGEREPSLGGDAGAQAAERAGTAHAYWEEAVELYESTLTEDEGSTSAMNGLQRVHALLGEYEESLAWTERLVERTREEMVVWRRMLTQADLTSKEENLYRENEGIAQRLLTETHLFASTLLYRLGREDEAIAHLDAVVAETPDRPQVYSLRAQLLAKTGDFPRAIEDLDRYLGLSDAPFEDPEVQRAFELRLECQSKLAARD